MITGKESFSLNEHGKIKAIFVEAMTFELFESTE